MEYTEERNFDDVSPPEKTKRLFFESKKAAASLLAAGIFVVGK